MCELLGLSFSKQVNPVFSFAGLMGNSDFHSDGWGLGCYPNNGRSAAIFKESIAGFQSSLAEFLGSYREMKSQIFVGHTRRASVGSISHENTHPFCRCCNGSEWLFAHNGSLQAYPGSRKGLLFLPLGSTDSEYAFCTLMTMMLERRIRPTNRNGTRHFTERSFSGIHQVLKEINVVGDGPLTCLFSDGQHLFCYRDMKGLRRLFYLKREAPFRAVHLRGSQFEVDLNLVKNESERGYVVASDHLTDESWLPFKPGQLIVFRDGEIVADLS